MNRARVTPTAALLLLVLWRVPAATGAAPEPFPRRNAVVAAVEKVGPAVVNISTEQITVRRGDPFFEFRDPFFDSFFRQYFDRFPHPQEYRSHSLGSGVIIDPEGHVVTNEHVVRRASKIEVALSDGSKYEARLLSSDAENDLALVQLDAKKPLPAIRMGRSDDLMIGETVIALGNPFGLESTVTTGVVSAKNRSVSLQGREAYSGLIQSDAAINPGNSGGALVNINGELIGINVAIYAEAQGIGFAIPIDRVREVLNGLFNYRVIKKTYIGVKVRDAAKDDAARLGATVHSGALVAGVDKDSPAAAAKLAPDDLIEAVDGRAVADTIEFFKRMLDKGVGDTVVLRVRSRGKERKCRVTVAAVPKPSGAELARSRLGVSLQPMTAELAKTFGLRQPVGLLITLVDSGGPGDRAGLVRGDIILRLGQFPVNSLDQLAIILEQISAGTDVSLQIVRRGRLYRAIVGLK